MTPELHTVPASDLPYYLMERGLVERRSVVDGDLVVVDASRRNRNHKVLRHQGPSYFIKQSRYEAGPTAESVRREAVFYELATRQEGWEEMRRFLPAYHGYDVARNLLVLRLADGQTSAVRALTAAGPGAEVASLTGWTLGRFHRAAAGLPPVPTGALPDTPPWILALHRLPAEAVPATSPGQRALAEEVRGNPRATRALDTAATAWERRHVVHGDLKWDNLLLGTAGDGAAASHQPAEEAPAPCRIVDWELAHVGDPAWDLGSLLQSLVGAFVPQAGAPHAHQVWEGLRRSASSLVGAYARARGLSDADLAATVLRSIRLGGGRAVQSAFELLHDLPAPTPQSRALLEHALGMVEDPPAWAASLVGLTVNGPGPGATAPGTSDAGVGHA